MLTIYRPRSLMRTIEILLLLRELYSFTGSGGKGGKGGDREGVFLTTIPNSFLLCQHV